MIPTPRTNVVAANSIKVEKFMGIGRWGNIATAEIMPPNKPVHRAHIRTRPMCSVRSYWLGGWCENTILHRGRTAVGRAILKLLGRLLRDFIRLGWPKAYSLTNRAGLLGHKVERQVEAAAKENEEKPIEFLGWYNVSIAKVAILWSAHFLYLSVM